MTNQVLIDSVERLIDVENSSATIDSSSIVLFELLLG